MRIPHLGDSAEIMAYAEQLAHDGFAEEMSVLRVNARSEEFFINAEIPKTGAQSADKLSGPKKLIANDSQADNEIWNAMLSKVINMFSVRKSAKVSA
jgi:hypothetical protein